jgi:hypothetical protein
MLETDMEREALAKKKLHILLAKLKTSLGNITLHMKTSLPPIT